MKKLILILSFIIALLSGCTVKQGKLVVIENETPSEIRQNKSIYEHLNVESRIFPIEKYEEAISRIDADMIPLAVSPDYSMVIAYQPTGSTVPDITNRRVVIGNMVQEINLYICTTENGESKSLGKFLSLKDFRFDETGNSFAFIDGNSNIYIYSSITGQLQKLVTAEKRDAYYSLSWSKDSKSLMINYRMQLDIASKEFISIAVESYTPFIRSKFIDSNYFVQMKNNEYNDMIALFDFSTKEFTSIANGIYTDSDNANVLYTKNYMSGLNIVSLKTLESKSIENGPVYCSYIMKSTGDILYSTVNNDLDSSDRYLLVKLNPHTMAETSISLDSPTFYMSPAEDKLYVISSYSSNNIVIDAKSFMVYQNGTMKDDLDLHEIKSTLLKMFQLDYNFNETYEKYETIAKEIYINTYDPLPQEALENKLIDFKRYNMPMPTSQREDHIPPTIYFDQLNITDSKASINLGLYYINSVEMVKEDGNWYITGFSTHPASGEIASVTSIVKKHLYNIKNKNINEAVKYWTAKKDTEYLEAQRKIVEELIAGADELTFEVGEIEFWSLSDPHRAESADRSTYAKVKIIIDDGNKINKYKLILSRQYKKQFEIESWNTDPLSISQLY